MYASRPGVSILVPDGKPLGPALRRVTHLGIGAHPDDLEIMAYHGILQHFLKARAWFGGVTVCNGAAGNPRLQATRRREQEAAAQLGKYACMVQLGYDSAEARKRRAPDIVADLRGILATAQPEVLYTHSPVDSHPTHTAVLQHVLAAVRELPRRQRPKRIYGCEVWRSMDWVPRRWRIPLEVGQHPTLAAELISCFHSQTRGKDYVRATHGRRAAHATFDDPNTPDAFSGVTYAVDLSDLVDGPARVRSRLERLLRDFAKEVLGPWRGAV
jgi:LmbE family N-acetylglucosaminyl deacetylase